MTPNDAHPSYLALDRAALGDGAPHVLAHAAGCERCSAYVAQLGARLPVPRWVSEAARRRRWRWPAWVGALALASSTAGLVLLVSTEQGAGSSEVRAKGQGPSVSVYVKRDGGVGLWDGISPLKAGDQVRLGIAPDGLRHAAVLSPTPEGDPQVLYQGELEAGPTLLPKAWQVDGAASSEQLIVVLSRTALATRALREAVTSLRRDEDVWATQLHLPTIPLGDAGQ